MNNIVKSKRGEGYIDTVVIVLSAMLVIALAVKVLPVFIAKNQLNTYANEVLRTAEISGRIGNEVNNKSIDLYKQTGIEPTILWQAQYITGTNKVQLNNEMTVTVEYRMDIGFFSFGSFPIKISSKATGRSEVYWK
ncbi:UNVERIFIED_CONTAM: uncharacterized protein DUF4320 [Acetivibrio alkalicellulosi]